MPSSMLRLQNHLYARLTRTSEHAGALNVSQTHSPVSASGSSTPDQSRDDRYASSRAQALCAPKSGRETRRSVERDDLEAPPCPDQTNKRIDLARLSAAPSL